MNGDQRKRLREFFSQYLQLVESANDETTDVEQLIVNTERSLVRTWEARTQYIR